MTRLTEVVTVCRVAIVAHSIRQQLADALTERGWSIRELHRRARLGCTEVSLSRKLRGKQTLRSTEVERLARVLRIEVTAGESA
jgi:uncharacterized protein (DUF488 family)